MTDLWSILSNEN